MEQLIAQLKKNESMMYRLFLELEKSNILREEPPPKRRKKKGEEEVFNKEKDKEIGQLKEQVVKLTSALTETKDDMENLHKQLISDDQRWSGKLAASEESVKALETENKYWSTLVAAYRTRHPEEFGK